MEIMLDNGGLLIIISAYGIGEGLEERLAECAIIYPPHPSYSRYSDKTGANRC